ncbi:MAG: ferritin [Coriobacteriia bacterium]|nr:ferritin [Coriobacteriia bacterium]
MKMYRCRICGETYLGSETPSHCPFCGAHSEYIVDTTEYPENINAVDITELERNDLMKAIDLELSNTRFYLAMGQHKDDHRLASAYKRLAKIEAEHCELFCTLVGIKVPAELMTPGEASDDWCANIEESVEREQRATKLYAEAAARATNPRVREVFTAISAVEADHIELDGVAGRLASC